MTVSSASIPALKPFNLGHGRDGAMGCVFDGSGHEHLSSQSILLTYLVIGRNFGNLKQNEYVKSSDHRPHARPNGATVFYMMVT
jgi:hypothetical protein